MSEAPFIVFGAPQIHRPEIDEVNATMESGWLGTGPRVAQFERAFAEYKGGRLPTQQPSILVLPL